MRIVSPGIAVWQPVSAQRDARRDARLGSTAGRLVALGWILALGGALVAGPLPTLHGRLLALLGVAWGITWARMRWDRHASRSLTMLVAVAALQAVAAMIALDPAALTSAPFFLIVAALGGCALRGRGAVALHAGGLSLGAAGVALLAPARAHGAPAHAALLAGGVLVVAAAAAALREARERRAAATARVGDARRLRNRLADCVAGDVERFALLAMDVGVPGVPRMAPAERDRLIQAVEQALVDEVRGKDLVARDGGGFSVVAAGTDARGARVLAQRIERAIAELELAQVGALNASIGIAVFPDDGTTPAGLLDHAGEDLREVRARRRWLRLVPSEPEQTIA